MKTVTNTNAGSLIAKREDFKNSRKMFWGQSHRPGSAYVDRGWLPKGFADFRSRTSYHYADYIVYSFKTPIGWHVPDHGWVVPEVTFSSRTNRHQGLLRSAIWDEIVLTPSWRVIPDSPTAAALLRDIRAGYYVGVAGKTRRVIDLVLATGEARLIEPGDGYPVGGPVLEPAAMTP